MTGARVRILLSRPAAQRLETQIREVLQGREVVLLHPGAAEAATADIAFVSRDVTGLSTKHRILPDTQRFYDTLLAARGLRWVHVHSAGADRAVYLELRARGVQLTTSAGANAPVVAQTALLGVLALARHWPRLVAAQREHRWAPLIESGLPRDLAGQTAVVVGWGSVGREIGRLLQAVGLEVVAVRRDADASDDKRVVGSAHLHAVLPQADWLVLACALTPQTRGLIGERELALLPRHAHVVNVARGEVVVEPALVDALRAQRIAGAYLDVFAHEPLAPDSPLWDLPNVIATPHSAGFSDANERHVDRMFLDHLGRFAAGGA
jgi:phosphoglycerate dehydrogenase-like enzyme